ncbi:MAG: hypothetical protein CSA83_01425 [Actinomycetales bacterium]|nr:MAG: hypothetical protein CSA83_01425 [Actinomycetales bacterium]
MAKYLIPGIAGALAITMVGAASFLVSEFATTPVTVSVDGQERKLEVRSDTVAEVLTDENIVLGEHDVVQPAPETEITNDMTIEVSYGRPLEVTIDGQKQTLWTTKRTLDQALAQLNVESSAEDKFSVSRSTAISRQGLSVSIDKVKDITVTVAGKPAKYRVAGKVNDALTEAKVTADDDDIVKPEPGTQLEDGMKIVYQKVDKKTVTKKVEIPFEKKTVKTSKMYKDQSKITTKGVKGVENQKIEETKIDGKVKSKKVVSKEIVKEPVTQVKQVGTKKRPKPKANSGGGGKTNLPPVRGGNTCKASYYWQGQMTANGEVFNTNAFTAAHKSLPFNTRVQVTNPRNGRSVIVRINDRGPYISGRCLDLSRAAMRTVNYKVL